MSQESLFFCDLSPPELRVRLRQLRGSDLFLGLSAPGLRSSGQGTSPLTPVTPTLTADPPRPRKQAHHAEAFLSVHTMDPRLSFCAAVDVLTNTSNKTLNVQKVVLR